MTIDYELVVTELKSILENLAQEDAEAKMKAYVNLSGDASDKEVEKTRLWGSHLLYIEALNDVLMATSKRYSAEYKAISPKLRLS